ncbi:MAG TPA: 2-iminoacetate synthase ThiH [Acidimicrobiales bacterium]|nr:2-iminoacetate synthase ThiH [Acidimicrobiales bacterium]
MTSIPVNIDSRPERVPDGTAAADVVATPVADLRRFIDRAGPADVERALNAAHPTLHDFAALLSAPGAARLEDLAQKANRLSRARFGATVRLFSPLYLSNECVSTCTYCGFSAGNEIARRTLSIDEVRREAEELHRRGFRHILLVAGEHARIVSKSYLEECVAAVTDLFAQVSVEVQVWDTDTYRRLATAGCDGVVVYQEVYDEGTYPTVHLKGKKRNYAWRLAAPDRAAEAGMRRLGIGSLLGLHPDWRSEAIALAAHASALIRRWWRCEVSVALPRLKPAAGGYEPTDPVDDASLVQLLCALRIFIPDVGITLSTREPASLRDALVPLGITSMSAGSHTEPGGYAEASDAEPQFSISDERSPAEVAAALRAAGFDPVWKDWQRA